MSDTILNIENITKSFPRVIANKKITFDIKKNAVHAISVSYTHLTLPTMMSV